MGTVLLPRTSNSLETQWVQRKHLVKKSCFQTCNTDHQWQTWARMEISTVVLDADFVTLCHHPRSQLLGTRKWNVILKFKSYFQIDKFLFKIDHSYTSWQCKFVGFFFFPLFFWVVFHMREMRWVKQPLETDQSTVFITAHV